MFSVYDYVFLGVMALFMFVCLVVLASKKPEKQKPEFTIEKDFFLKMQSHRTEAVLFYVEAHLDYMPYRVPDKENEIHKHVYETKLGSLEEFFEEYKEGEILFFIRWKSGKTSNNYKYIGPIGKIEPLS